MEDSKGLPVFGSREVWSIADKGLARLALRRSSCAISLLEDYFILCKVKRELCNTNLETDCSEFEESGLSHVHGECAERHSGLA